MGAQQTEDPSSNTPSDRRKPADRHDPCLLERAAIPSCLHRRSVSAPIDRGDPPDRVGTFSAPYPVGAATAFDRPAHLFVTNT